MDRSAAMSAQYFYGEPGGKTMGPLPLESIQAAAKSGRLSAATMVSRDGAEPWASLDDLSRFGVAAFESARLDSLKAENLSRSAAAEVAPDPPRERIQEGSVGGFLQLFGWINIAMACVLICVTLAAVEEGKPIFQLITGVICCALSGVFFLAIAEVLTRLKEISSALNSKTNL
jgi:hypothetical protein